MTPRRIHITSRFMPNPPHTRRVTRPSRWGNPFKLIADGGPYTVTESRELYRTLWLPSLAGTARRLLRGWNLACTCPLDAEWCHADDLLIVANGGEVPLRKVNPPLRKVKGGWVAMGDGWAVFGPTKEEARTAFERAKRRNAEMDARQLPGEQGAEGAER